MTKTNWLAFGMVLSACNAAEPAPNSSVPGQATSRGDAVVAEAPPASEPAKPPAKAGAAAHPCLVQDDRPVTHRLKALGTEPFWAAEVEGRCVTYKTPENQQGTRIWTRVETGPQGPVWNGALGGRQFQLTVRPAAASCSDGMSDRRYPMDATLRVNGETRGGCATPELESAGERP